MEKEQLREKYKNLPQEMQAMKRWVGYKVEEVEGRMTKVPYNAINGQKAASNNPTTWTTFGVALNGVIKYGFTGLGFMLGDGITGIDLDNHEDPKTGKKPMGAEEFKSFCDCFVKKMGTYAEYSQSGEGVHIICKGVLPEGRRRCGSVEMYSKGRFFACTGNVILSEPVNDRQEELTELWKEYVDDSAKIMATMQPKGEFDFSGVVSPAVLSASSGACPAGTTTLTDEEVLRKASSSDKTGLRFVKLLQGDLSDYGGDHSGADLAMCSILAFWCNGDYAQIDRIFRTTALMREKWDSFRGSDTYGNITIAQAIKTMGNGYIAPRKTQVISEITAKTGGSEANDGYMNLENDGQTPIFRRKDIFKNYPFTDTGNAERFYDQFGKLFKFDKKAQVFMFWTGKVWQYDVKNIIRKYANELIEIMKDDHKRLLKEVEGYVQDGDKDGAKEAKSVADAMARNIDRVSNKAGKDAMLSELQSMYDIPVETTDFNKDPFLINTDSGIVDLRDGNIKGFDREAMLSKTTGIGVSYDEPTTWLKFLHDIFYRGNDPKAKAETEELVDFIQQCLGYTLTGSTREQVMFIMYGGGSNGKSTFVNQVTQVLGDYGSSIDSNMLMAQSGYNTSVQFSLAQLVGARFLITKETNEGDKLDEGLIKGMTGGDAINAQEKYGKPFIFVPQFKTWMMTNNLPIIRGTDYGIWRRIVTVPFLRKFADHEKDMDMPQKLKDESEAILGWCIKGYLKYQENGSRFVLPSCLKEALKGYQNDMDVVSKFMSKSCKKNVNSRELCVEMYNSFKNWTNNNREFQMKESKFAESLVQKGYRIEVDKLTGERYYVGVELLQSARTPGNFAYRPIPSCIKD